MLPYLGKATAEHADTNKQCNFARHAIQDLSQKGVKFIRTFMCSLFTN